MGTWGAGLYANDCTCDVRDTYMKYLQEQFSNEEAYEKTIEMYGEYIGEEEEPLLWYALADTQWRMGRLMPEVKRKALDWIDQIGGIENWEESKNRGIGWRRTLEKLRKQLHSPMPCEKKIRKPVEFIRNPWNIGDVYAYQFHSEESKEMKLFGKYILFQKVEDKEWYDGWILSKVQVFDQVYDQLPTVLDLEEVRILPLDSPDLSPIRGKDKYLSLCTEALMIYEKKRDYPGKHFTFIKNTPKMVEKSYERYSSDDYYWCDLEQWLCECYVKWREYDYEIEGKIAYIHKK